MQEREESAAGLRGSDVTFSARAVSKVRWYRAALRRAALLISLVSLALLTRASLFISLLSLAFSGVTLYLTVLRQPRLTIFAGCNWQYGRGPGSKNEYFVIPVTVANDGARGDTVLAIELTVAGGERSKAFAGNFTIAAFDDKPGQLFAPIAIAGRSSATASIVFTQRSPPTEPFLVNEPGRYDARLKVRTAVGSSHGFIDRLFASPPPDELHLKSLLQRLDISATALGRRESFDVCDLEDLPTAQAN
jgi:hypothetical protein